MNIVDAAKKRYSAKAFDPTRKLSEAQIQALKTVLHLSPSSINFQPWHFIMATSDTAKGKIADACQDLMAYNAQKIKDAALVVVLCAQTKATHAQVQAVIAQEAADGRYSDNTAEAERLALLNTYIERLNQDPQNANAWLNRQTYIALGNVLLAAASMGIDSAAIEGFDPAVVNRHFDLPAKGYHANVLAAFGYHSDADFNADLPKSRLPQETLFTFL